MESTFVIILVKEEAKEEPYTEALLLRNWQSVTDGFCTGHLVSDWEAFTQYIVPAATSLSVKTELVKVEFITLYK